MQEIARSGLGASTANIGVRGGLGRRHTLDHLPSKETLFKELYPELKKEPAQRMIKDFPTGKNLKGRVRHIWMAYLGWRWSAQTSATFPDCCISQASSSEVRAQVHQTEIKATVAKLTNTPELKEPPSDFAPKAVVRGIIWREFEAIFVLGLWRGSNRPAVGRGTGAGDVALPSAGATLGGQKDLQSISKGSGIFVRTLQRWVLSYRRVGLAGLVKKGRRDKGKRRAVSPRLREAIEGLALEKPALPLTSVHRHVKQFAQTIGEAEPSYWMVRDVALSIPNDLRTLAQQATRQTPKSWSAPCS